MKRLLALVLLGLAMVVVVSPNPGQARSRPTAGQILKIVAGDRAAGRSLTVRVPRSLNQVVLERKIGKGWKPVKAIHLPFNSEERSKLLPLTLPAGLRLSQVRVLGYSSSKFPDGFAKGPRTFARPTPLIVDGKPMLNNATGDAAATGDSPMAGAAGPAAPEAEESDIWKIVGDQLFFFNQYRGLQIFDLRDPANPVRTGTLRLAASGEQMYVLNPKGGRTLALIGRANNRERAGQPTLFLLEVLNGVPALVAELALPGSVCDSRLIGETLYVLSSVWQPATDDDTEWHHHLVLQAIDLTRPADPVLLPELRLQGGQASLQAADDCLLIGVGDYSWPREEQVMHLVNIATADGTPELKKSFRVKGFIQDKFKMGLVKGAAVAVSSRWHKERLETWIETFPVDGPGTLPLAGLELEGARDETPHATRFDGDRLYAVTFRNVDPLFVVDLADPARPAIHGILEIPGWSTYLEPLGDRLLAVGVENQRVTISLFDVAKAAAPVLLSRVSLGAEGAGSWSEANYDEKAVEYAATAGLLFVPFQTWTDNACQTALQVIRVERDSLVLAQTIPSSHQARRGTVMGHYLVAISGQELIVHDRAAAADAPLVRMPLAWLVDSVVPFGNYLAQIDDGPRNYSGIYRAPWSLAGDAPPAVIRVTQAHDPDALIEEIELGAGRIVGAIQKDNRLFVAQWLPATAAGVAVLRTRVMDLGQPPLVEELAVVDHQVATAENSLQPDSIQGLWLGKERLIWYVPGRLASWNWWWDGPLFIGRPVENPQTAPLASGGRPGSAAPVSLLPAKAPIPSTYTAALLCPINLTGPPVASPVTPVASAQEVRGASSAHVENGFVFFSYDTVTDSLLKPADGLARPFRIPPRPRQLHSNLQVIDCRRDTVVTRDPVSIPGQLLSVSQADAQGAILLTTSQGPDDGQRLLQAAAYDGVHAWQLDELDLDVPFWGPTATAGARLFFGRDQESPGVLSVGYNAETGRLRAAGEWTTTASPASLDVRGPHLLASGYGILEMAMITDTGIDPRGPFFETPTNLWLRLDRLAFSDRGLWLPANDYGVEFLPWTTVWK